MWLKIRLYQDNYWTNVLTNPMYRVFRLTCSKLGRSAQPSPLLPKLLTRIFSSLPRVEVYPQVLILLHFIRRCMTKTSFTEHACFSDPKHSTLQLNPLDPHFRVIYNCHIISRRAKRRWLKLVIGAMAQDRIAPRASSRFRTVSVIRCPCAFTVIYTSSLSDTCAPRKR